MKRGESIPIDSAVFEHPGDSQKVELLGRNRLIDDLLRDRLEVALPIRDRGVDLIAYADLAADVDAYIARPVQMKAAWERSFAISKKYLKIKDLVFAYVWHLSRSKDAVTYALTYDEALMVAEGMGWTKTDSWNQGGGYSTTQPSGKLLALLEPHLMTPGKWWEKVVGGNKPPPPLLAP